MPGPEPIARLALTLCDDAVGIHRLRQLVTATAVYQAFTCDQQLRLISQHAHASRDLRRLGKSILSVACDRALVHGGREFMRVPQELAGLPDLVAGPPLVAGSPNLVAGPPLVAGSPSFLMLLWE